MAHRVKHAGKITVIHRPLIRKMDACDGAHPYPYLYLFL